MRVIRESSQLSAHSSRCNERVDSNVAGWRSAWDNQRIEIDRGRNLDIQAAASGLDDAAEKQRPTSEAQSLPCSDNLIGILKAGRKRGVVGLRRDRSSNEVDDILALTVPISGGQDQLCNRCPSPIGNRRTERCRHVLADDTGRSVGAIGNADERR